MDNRRLLLAVFLSWIVVIVWGLAFGPRPSETPPEPPAVSEEVPGPEAGSDGDQRPATAGSAVATGEAAVSEEPSQVAELESIEASEERALRIETPTYRAELTNRGGQLVTFLLKEQLDGEGNPLDLIRDREAGLLPFALVDRGGLPLEVNEALFRVEEQELADGRRELVFEYRGELGSASKRFTFSDDGSLEIDFGVVGRADWSVFVGPGISNPTEEKYGQAQFWRGAVYRNGSEKIKRIDARKAKESKELAAGDIRWVALDDQYFISALIPRSGVGTIGVVPYWVDGPEGDGGSPVPVPVYEELSKEQRNRPRSLALLLHARSERISAESFWGAKVYEQLARQPFGLEHAINYGWFSFLARPLQWALNQLHGHVVPNYGWAIVLLTIAIKLLLLPLTHKSMTSAQKMQVLNPKVQAIRTRYRSKLKDGKGRPNLEMQRKMQDEIMTLYKAEGVNPAGGCLPMLVQIPVFFAFYQLLGAAIELRNAPWIGWIQDLSSMDPHYVLPLVMFATQFLQQLRMPMGTDPMQRRLFLLMPFMFLFIFLKFPSGLVLYWLTNNVFSILQQEVYLRRKKRVEAALPAHSPPKKKKRSS